MTKPVKAKRKNPSINWNRCPTSDECFDCGNDCPGYNWGPNIYWLNKGYSAGSPLKKSRRKRV